MHESMQAGLPVLSFIRQKLAGVMTGSFNPANWITVTEVVELTDRAV